MTKPNWAARRSNGYDLVFLSWECFSVDWYYNDRSEQRAEKVRVGTSSIWSAVFILLLIKCQHYGQWETKRGRNPGSKCHFSHKPVFSTDSLRKCGDRVILNNQVTASVCLRDYSPSKKSYCSLAYIISVQNVANILLKIEDVRPKLADHLGPCFYKYAHK